MSRSTSFIGLNDRARKLVEGRMTEVTDHTIRTWPDGRTENLEPVSTMVSDTVVLEGKSGCVHGMFGEPYPLDAYRLFDGTLYKEKVQAEPWSSGPVIFTALVDGEGKWVEESKWTDEEIGRHIGV